jgi:hypothetical protein
MARQEDGWKTFTQKGKALNIAIELETAGFNLKKYLQDDRDKNVKPIDYYWQGNQADKPKPGA